MAPPRTLPMLPGMRPIAGDALTIIQKRLPALPKAEQAGSLMAVDPLQVVLSGYAERADEALARAKLFQEGEPLQYLDEGRWFDRPLAGVTGQEMPLVQYSGRTIPGRTNIEGLFRSADGPLASIQVAAGSPDPRAVLLEESRHAIDRQLVPGGRPNPFKAPDAFASLLSAEPFDRAKQYMNYYSIPDEMRATLSGMLAESPEFINTTQQATDLLERLREAGTVRERATAEGILNSKALRNEYIPYLLKALSAGGVAAGINSQENQ